MNDSMNLIWMDPKAWGHTKDSVNFIRMNPKEYGRTNDWFVWLEWVLVPFAFVRPNIYCRLGSNSIVGFMPFLLASLIEGYWCIWILLLFVIGFNPSNVYLIFYGTMTYGDISICSYLGYWIGAYVRFLLFVWLF